MSLLIWMPLNGNLNNNGANRTTVSSGAPSYSSAGKFGECFSGSGNIDLITTNTVVPITATNEYSICCWIKKHTDITSGVWVFYLGDGTGTCRGLWTCNTHTSKLHFAYSGSGIDVSAPSDINLQDGKWHHICFTIANPNITLWVDGKKGGTKTLNSTGLQQCNIERLRFNTQYYSLNDFRVYDHVLSIREIKQISKGLMLWYNFETLANNIIYDNSGCNYNGTIIGTPTLDSNTCKGNKSIKFSSNSSYIKVPQIDFSSSDVTNNYTISWWSTINDMYGKMAWGFSNGNKLNFYPTTNGFCWNTGDGAENPFKDTTGAVIPYSQYNNSWHLYTVTGDGTVNKLYIDGLYKGTALTYREITGTRLYISGWNTTTSYKWNPGNMADFKIYSTVLSDADILAEYENKAILDNSSNLFTTQIVEDSSFPSINKNFTVNSKVISELMTLDDGSIWVPINIHYAPDGLFSSINSVYKYEKQTIWNNFGIINSASRPESNWYEFYIINQATPTSAVTSYRFKQNKNPFNAVWADVEPSKIGTNVIKNIEGEAPTYGGMYWKRNLCAMCFANATSSNWFGCGVVQYWHSDRSDIPSYNGESVKGWQLVYMRISKRQARVLKDIINNNTFNETI